MYTFHFFHNDIKKMCMQRLKFNKINDSSCYIKDILHETGSLFLKKKNLSVSGGKDLNGYWYSLVLSVLPIVVVASLVQKPVQ